MPQNHKSAENVTYLWVAETVLKKHGRPLKVREIVNFGLEDGLFPDQELSRTPQKSMQARLSMEILQNGANSRFLRTARGLFFLRELHKAADPTSEYTAVRRYSLPPSERVLAIGEQGYRGVLDFQGIDLFYVERLKKLIESDRLTYLWRTDAETNDLFKQFISYTIIQHESKVLCFRRGQYNQTATFLRGSLCIGFGGHVTDNDRGIFSYKDYGIKANAAREISEEIRFRKGRPNIDPESLEILGILNDDSSDVGVRHLGVILRYWAPGTLEWTKPLRGEASINQLKWIDLRAPDLNLIDFEYWSQLCLRKLYPSTVSARPSFKVIRRKPFNSDHILCVIGSIGSGKSIASEILRDEAGYFEVNSGEVMATVLGIEPIPVSPRNVFQIKAQELMSRPEGAERFVDALLARAAKTPNQRVLIDGIRHPETLKAIKERSGRDVGVLFVHTPPDIAYQLYTDRLTGDSKPTPAEFAFLMNAPVESKIRYMIDEADAIVFNWFGLEPYRFLVRELIEELGLNQHVRNQKRRL
jgi:predicted NUDIX family phosphoesterase/dephospho-CoA kinase